VERSCDCGCLQVRIVYPAEGQVRQCGEIFPAFGSVLPSRVRDLTAWIEMGKQKLFGQPMTSIPPYNWAFLFTNVPPKTPFRLVVRARDECGRLACDFVHVLCGDAETLIREDAHITITLPAPPPTPPVVGLNFSAGGNWVTQPSTLTAEVDTLGGVKLGDGQRVIPPLPGFRWMFVFNLDASTAEQDANLVVIADGNPTSLRIHLDPGGSQ
jgi:hypothetical protein